MPVLTLDGRPCQTLPALDLYVTVKTEGRTCKPPSAGHGQVRSWGLQVGRQVGTASQAVQAGSLCTAEGGCRLAGVLGAAI